MSKVDDNCDARPSDEGAYILSEQDHSIIAATSLLLGKITRLPAITPRQAEAVAKVREVFGRLPRVSEELNIAVSLAGPRRCYGEHKISHYWRIAVAGNDLEVSSGGDFWRPSTGGDSFTCMEWQAAPGYEANFEDYLNRHQIVDDAQPYEIEVARLAITEPGYRLSIEWDGEELDSEEDDEEDAVCSSAAKSREIMSDENEDLISDAEHMDMEAQVEHQRLLDSPDELEALADRLEIPEDGMLMDAQVWEEAYRRLQSRSSSADDRD